jgi:uncharacterized membrane protein
MYSVLVYVLSEISFGLVQVRVADCLIPLSMLFGWPVIVGAAAGCLVGNLVSPMPSIITDMTFGALANLVASFLAWKIGCRKSMKTANVFFGCVAATVVITFVVGTYLALLTEMELWVWWLGVGVGSMISINILGYTLVQTIKKTGVV